MTRCLSMTLLAGLALLAARPAPGATLPAAPGYVITDLGSLGGGQTYPVAINVKGDTAGYSTTAAGQIHAFLLPANGPMQDLGALGGSASYATSLNNRGDVVGYSTTAAGQTHAFAILDGQMSDLGLAAGVANKAVGINDLRQVLVVSDAGGGNTSSALWQNGQTTPLGTLGGNSTSGGALNNLGQVVGNATAADSTNHAFAYDPTARKLVDLGTIGPGSALSHVNEIGQAVGTRITPDGYMVAFGADLTRDSNFLADKRFARGLDGTIAYWINNEGVTVGAGVVLDPPSTNAGVWTPDFQYQSLSQALVANSGWVIYSATAVNDARLIVGKAVAPDGQVIAYMLTVSGPELPAEKALAIAASLDPAIQAVRNGFDAAASAATPSPLETTLVDLQQARSLLTPTVWQATVGGVSSGQASHLLSSAVNLLTIPNNSPFLPPADRDAALAIIAAARKGLQ